ncbi:MAG: TIGR03617 family F420-dependent LLM class oxidoreductase [Alphaproteobacteria bacterium]|nr:TIGR03617 family F420-dependent LLM class oxidoreductase [Alphaproteobacteria bacterium]
MQIMTTLPQEDLNTVPDAARAAERAGFDLIATMENRYEPFMPLAVSAIATERIQLGTAVAIAFPRSPMVVANTGWDLQKASKGRFVLGLGPQIKPHNEKRFSTPWSAPAPRLREYVKALKAIWRSWELGEPLKFSGAHYTFTLMTPNFVPTSARQPPVPVTLAAVGPHTLKLTGEVCDGVRLHPFCTRAYLEEVAMPKVAEGLMMSGTPREEFQVSGGGFIATGATDGEVQQVAEWVRYRIAFYGSTPSYWPVFEHHGLGDLGRKLNRMTKEGQWDRIAAEISDDVLRLFAAIGRHDELVSLVDARFGGSTDMIYASTSSDIQPVIPPGVLQDIQRIETPFKGFRMKW